MCGPVAIAAVQMGVQATGQVLQMKAQDKEAQTIWKSDLADLEGKYNATQAREQQEQLRTAQAINVTNQQALSTTGRIRVQQASRGVSGRTADQQLQSPESAAENYAAIQKENLANTLAQNQLDATSFKAKAQSVINENPAGSRAALGVELAGDVAGVATAAVNQQAAHPNAAVPNPATTSSTTPIPDILPGPITP